MEIAIWLFWRAKWQKTIAEIAIFVENSKKEGVKIAIWLPRRAKYRRGERNSKNKGPRGGPWQSEYLSRESQFLLWREAFVKEFEIVGIFLGYEIRLRSVVNALNPIQIAFLKFQA